MLCPMFPTVTGRGNNILAIAFLSIMGNSITESFKKSWDGVAGEKRLFQRKKISLYQPKDRDYHLYLTFPLKFPLEGKDWGKKEC